MIWQTVLVSSAAAVGAAAIGCSKPARQTPVEKPLGPVQAPGYIAPEALARAVDFSGSCSWGRPPGDARRYRVRLRARDNPNKAVIVRSTAVFDPADDSNVMGELESGRSARGDGPVYDGRTGRRGYAILVRGTAGRVCRGYVSETAMARE